MIRQREGVLGPAVAVGVLSAAGPLRGGCSRPPSSEFPSAGNPGGSGCPRLSRARSCVGRCLPRPRGDAHGSPPGEHLLPPSRGGRGLSVCPVRVRVRVRVCVSRLPKRSPGGRAATAAVGLLSVRRGGAERAPPAVLPGGEPGQTGRGRGGGGCRGGRRRGRDGEGREAAGRASRAGSAGPAALSLRRAGGSRQPQPPGQPGSPLPPTAPAPAGKKPLL